MKVYDINLLSVEHWHRTGSVITVSSVPDASVDHTLDTEDFLADAGGIFGSAYHMSDGK